MAYFIVIGTTNDVKDVVDEIKKSHLQHNVVTSGCILNEGEGLYYHWDVFNEKGDKTKENKEPIVLHDALTNQISHFKTLLPNDAIPYVFIVSKCFNDEESYTLQMVCDELYQIGGAIMCGLQVDIILLGYNLNRAEDVTIRPHWRVLESLHGLETAARFHTNILYINNMDYNGAATNINSRVLGRFLCHWSKMVCAGGYNPKSTIRSNVYSIGMSEHQYDFRDLNEFFKLSAEEKLLERKLNASPSPETRKLLDFNYYKKIDLELQWIDGLYEIQSIWNSYCSTEWNPSNPLSNNIYSVSRHEQELAAYLNSFLKLYIIEEIREIRKIELDIKNKEQEIVRLSEEAELTEENPTIEEKISQLESEIKKCQNRINIHKQNIDRNTFLDADEFHQKYGTAERITEEDETNYSTNYTNIGNLIEYAKSDTGINVMREAIDRAILDDILPQPYPAASVFNIGRSIQREMPHNDTSSLPNSATEVSAPDELADRPGCLMWLKSFFTKKNTESIVTPTTSSSDSISPISNETRNILLNNLNNSVAALKKVDDIRKWWKTLCNMIEEYQLRKKECRRLMDGERDLNGEYILNKEGYRPKCHMKSISLIDMERVRFFRDTNAYYKENIDKFLNRWFDAEINPNQRMTMHELIKHQVLDPLVGRFHTLKWDGSNPFVKEELTNEEMNRYIEYNIRQSKPFVEYVRIQESNISSDLNIGFFSNNPNIPTDSTKFRNQYGISSESINPVYIKDFVNSLSVVQVMDIPNHIDALKDFKPRREAELSRLRTDIGTEAAAIVGERTNVVEKAKAIYDWICNNIAYDTTKQIFDAETCWRSRRGVCMAYCEIFCYMAEAVGLTADIIVGKTKNHKGEISEEKHAWIFVYTHAYEGMLIDPTWGAGGIIDGKFVRNTNKSLWFNVSPYWMIFSHLPDTESWKKIDIEINENSFEKLPYMSPIENSDGKDILFEHMSKI